MPDSESEPLSIWRRDLAAAAARTDLFHRVEVVGSIGSTMDLAKGLPAGTFATCLEQTAGRGRRGRSWFDGGAGVAATAVLNAARFDPGEPLLSTRAGLAMLAAVEPWLGRRAELKWPNDLMSGERKVGGALVERIGDRVHVGIGINVDPVRRPPELEGVAASLGELATPAPTRLAVACALLDGLDAWMAAPASKVRSAWSDRDWLRGRLVRIRDRGVPRVGRVWSIEAGSHLDLRAPDGSAFRVAAATAEILAILARPDDSDPL